MYEKEINSRKEKLEYISRTNKQHSDLKPVYGQDLCDAVNIFKEPYTGRVYRTRDKSKWNGPGHIHCRCAKLCPNPCRPQYLWNQTKVLSNTIHTPEQYLEELKDVIERCVFRPLYLDYWDLPSEFFHLDIKRTGQSPGSRHQMFLIH